MPPSLSDAHADRDVYLMSTVFDNQLFNDFAQTLGDRHDGLQWRMDQRYGELLAPDAADEILLAQHFAADGGDLSQHLVAARVTEFIVDALEMIDIEDDEAERVAVALRTP